MPRRAQSPYDRLTSEQLAVLGKILLFNNLEDITKVTLLFEHLYSDVFKNPPIPLSVPIIMRDIPTMPLYHKVRAVLTAYPGFSPAAMSTLFKEGLDKIYAQTKKAATK